MQLQITKESCKFIGHKTCNKYMRLKKTLKLWNAIIIILKELHLIVSVNKKVWK